MRAVYITLRFIALALVLQSSSASAITAAVAMPDKYSAQATQDILRRGGNAIDAAITAAFVLAVSFPEAGNLGGGGFMVSHMNGEDAFLDFRERAPLKAHSAMFLDANGNVIPNESLIGGKASGVPGTVRGMYAAHQRYGSMPWATLVQPAIDLANKGFVVHKKLAQAAKERTQELNGQTNFSQYFSNLKTGQIFKQAELAATLLRIAADPEEFYTGKTAQLLVAQMQISQGIITLEDMASYKAIWREPVRENWRGFTIISAPPPSSGGIALVQLLKMRDYANAHFKALPHNSPQYIHLLAELEKRVYADRAEYLGDPDFADVPIAALLEETYLKRRASEIDPKNISNSPAVKPGLESPDTTHFSILDKNGNAVAITTTLNWDFGSGVTVEGAGFLLNNEMDDFSAKPGVMNVYGMVGSASNAIQANKTMLSSMTPTILLKEKRPALILGTVGGSTIFTSVFQVILNSYDYAMPLQSAINATRFHNQLPEGTRIRHDHHPIPLATTRDLEALGYSVEANSWGNIGDIQAIRIDGDIVQAASDVRGRGESRLID